MLEADRVPPPFTVCGQDRRILALHKQERTSIFLHVFLYHNPEKTLKTDVSSIVSLVNRGAQTSKLEASPKKGISMVSG